MPRRGRELTNWDLLHRQENLVIPARRYASAKSLRSTVHHAAKQRGLHLSVCQQEDGSFIVKRIK